MNELIDAAKAVIEDLDNPRVFNVRDITEQQLRAAVERAEQQKAVGFEEWWDQTDYGWREETAAKSAWIAAQQAERERCREWVITMGGPDVPELLRQIDSGED